MDKRQQWKALRAPFWYRVALTRKHCNQTIAARQAQGKAVEEWMTLPFRKVLQRELLKLWEMRAAERAGMDPLLWKLSQP